MAVFFKYILTVLFVGILLWVTVMNRDEVTFSLFPFFENKPVSFTILFTGGVFLGFIWGAMIVWLNNADLRHSFRKLRRRVKAIESNPSISRNITPV